MEEVANHGNLKRAFKQVAANKGAPGPDRQSIGEVRRHLDTVLAELAQSLLDGSYRPGDIRRVWIPKPGGGKRGLGIPNVIDRLVQQAVLQVLSPLYEPTFHSGSHGFRPRRSCHTAIAEAKGHVEDGYRVVVDIDLEKFFDRVNHQRLLRRLEQRVTDRRLLTLIRHMLKARVVMPDGVVIPTIEGTPQGGPLSPLLSNIVLDELDQELTRRGLRFVRYADDCNIYVASIRAGKRVMASISRFIEKRLRLKVNTSKSAVAQAGERHFVGFCLKYNQLDGEVEVLPSERSERSIRAKIVELTPRMWGQSLQACIARVNRYLIGWFHFFKACGNAAARLFGNLDAHIRRRLRAIQLRHWKRRRTMARRLIKLGVRPRTAWRGIYAGFKTWWALSHCPAVNLGLPNAYFAERGLFSLARALEPAARNTVSAPRQLALDWDRLG
jgi:group II intron reverse transcriptase/maturase